MATVGASPSWLLGEGELVLDGAEETTHNG
jgi:hypothetical protein